jgi:lysozyme family protein
MLKSDFPVCRAWLQQPGFAEITQREYAAWCALHGSPAGDVVKASPDTITAIYRSQYWNPYCPLLPAGVNLVFFDIAVAQGQDTAVRILQQALGIEADGHFGVVTAAAVKHMNRPSSVSSELVIRMMTSARIHHYRGTQNFELEGKDWTDRAYRCQAVAFTLAGVEAQNGVQSPPNVVA